MKAKIMCAEKVRRAHLVRLRACKGTSGTSGTAKYDGASRCISERFFGKHIEPQEDSPKGKKDDKRDQFASISREGDF